RFHNNVKLLDTPITWKGNQYVAAPVQAIGFEMNGRGTLPTPKLAISVNPEGIPALALLKQQLSQLDDLIGAKVTRIRTYAENLDPINFLGTNINYSTYDPTIEPPELPRDIYYIDRKSAENKTIIEFELASILDVEGVKLPNRMVLANRCTATYRCEGCLYEYKVRFNEEIHGDAVASNLPDEAPPMANDKDELITEIINAPIVNPVPFDNNNLRLYLKGASVYITKNGVPYYFVAKTPFPKIGPPDLRYWIADQCSKSIKGCKIRWKDEGAGTLPFVAFPGTDRIR
ncbi:MAG: phage minor tail protein L, partial [Nanoarchaeota archaeon]